MRATLITASVAIATLASFAFAWASEIEVILGDVIRVGDSEWRIANIDAPQIQAKCKEESQLGVLAQAKLAELLGQGEMEIAPTGERDEHERKMARVRMNGEDIGDKMLAVSLAQPHGRAKPLCKSKANSALDNFNSMQAPMRGSRGM